MSVFSDIGSAGAVANLAVAQAMGTVIQHSYNGATDFVSLYACILEQSMGVKTSEFPFVMNKGGRLVFDVPVQDGLLPWSDEVRPILHDDEIIWSNRSYKVKYPIELKCNGYVYHVECEEIGYIDLVASPHTVVLSRPEVTRDVKNNSTKLDFSNLDTGYPRDVDGYFVEGGGEVVEREMGQVLVYDAVFYTKDMDLLVNDRVEPVGLTIDRFIVTRAERKFGLDGVFSMIVAHLTREKRFE